VTFWQRIGKNVKQTWAFNKHWLEYSTGYRQNYYWTAVGLYSKIKL